MNLTYNGTTVTLDQINRSFGTSLGKSNLPVSEKIFFDKRKTAGPVVKPFDRYLERLVINVANYCNLNCVYCYAKGGDYGGPTERLAESIGRKAVAGFLEKYDQIGLIQFFGGEPLLNFKLIDALCAYCASTCENLNKKLPHFGIVTNGTILNDEIISMISRHQIEVTVSLDGPHHINNALRFSGKARLDTNTVVNNIRRLKTECDQPKQIEGTFTQLHLDSGISVCDILAFVREELDVGILHLANNILSDSSNDGRDRAAIKESMFEVLAESYAKAVVTSFNDILTKPVHKITVLGMATEIIDVLINLPAVRHLCPAGSGTISVDSDGQIYPCFMFYRKKDFVFGNVSHTADDFINKDKQDDFLNKNLISSMPSARESWVAPFFHGCAGGNYHASGDHSNTRKADVIFFETVVAAGLVELTSIKSSGNYDLFLTAAKIFKIYHSMS